MGVKKYKGTRLVPILRECPVLLKKNWEVVELGLGQCCALAIVFCFRELKDVES
jgi:hypothetical protein